VRETGKAERSQSSTSDGNRRTAEAQSGQSTESIANVTLGKPAGDQRTWLTVAKLASLLSTDLHQAETQLLRMKYSRAEVQAALTILRCLPQLRSPDPATGLSCREQYFLFQSVGAAFPALVVLAIAVGVSSTVLEPLIQHFLTPDDPVAHPTAMVSGKDLMQHLQLVPGPQIGQLLAAVQLARAEGLVATPAEALEFAAKMMHKS
jgi:tRNA nucleotidyltransferase (CCA-adding enzyme)